MRVGGPNEGLAYVVVVVVLVVVVKAAELRRRRRQICVGMGEQRTAQVRRRGQQGQLGREGRDRGRGARRRAQHLPRDWEVARLGRVPLALVLVAA